MRQGGGPGFTAAGKKEGVYSERKGTITFNLRCKWHTQYNCCKQLRVVCHLCGKEIDLEDATTWPHSHDGPFQAARGLPPDIKGALQRIMTEHGRITPTAAYNLLTQRGYNTTGRKTQVQNYVYNNPPASKLEHVLGASAFGTVAALCENDLGQATVLAKPDATICDVFTIGSKLEPERGRGFVLFSSIKGLLFAFLAINSGYGEGQLMVDFTYKIFKEKLQMITYGIHDIAQSGRFCAFGPSTHEDQEITEDGAVWLHREIGKIIDQIASNTLPDIWATALKVEVMSTYAHIVNSFASPVRVFGGVLADCAQAIPNGTIAGGIIKSAEDATPKPEALKMLMIVVKRSKTCWSHIWRTMMATGVGKLKDKSQDAKDELYEDLALIHECPYDLRDIDDEEDEGVIGIFKDMMVKKWTKRGETDLVKYLQQYILVYNFSRCDGYPGDATGTDALERGHLNIKSDNYFNYAESIGNVLVRLSIIGKNLYMNMKPLAMVPKPDLGVWKRAQRLVDKNWFALGFKYGDYYILPAERMLKEHIPATCDTVAKQRDHIKGWAKEICGLLKKGSKYKKLNDGEWDFDVTADMLLSFWVLHEVPEDHPHRKALLENGIAYRCNCPDFNHHHRCKHAIAMSIILKGIKVPVRFSAKAMGKRKAPAGSCAPPCLVALHILGRLLRPPLPPPHPPPRKVSRLSSLSPGPRPPPLAPTVAQVPRFASALVRSRWTSRRSKQGVPQCSIIKILTPGQP